MSGKPIHEKLKLELFIAHRLLNGSKSRAVSVPIVKIAVAGIALGVCVMLLSVFIILGFKNEITTKLSGFTAHLNMTAYENNESYTGNEIEVSDSLVGEVRRLPGVVQAYTYVTKPAILKSKEEIHGVILKGMDTSYRPDFYTGHLQSGEYPHYAGEEVSDEVVVSASVARLLNVGVGDKITAHFVQDPPRVRVFTVKGIYDTGFKEYDDIFVLCDMRHLQRLNGWGKKQVSGMAVEIEDLKEMAGMKERIELLLPMDEENDFYRVATLREMAPQVFDWLSLLNMNVWIILILIVVVAGFNMVSGLLIFILDQTSFIGMMKALGYKNLRLRRLFLWIALGLIGRGMLVGNVLAILLGGLQSYFRIVKLDAATYYMDTVPVCMDIFYGLLLNAGVLLVSLLMLIIPTMLISRIRPIQAIRFE